MFCEKCGAEISNGMAFCARCGASQQPAAQPQQSYAGQPQANPYAGQQPYAAQPQANPYAGQQPYAAQPQANPYAGQQPYAAQPQGNPYAAQSGTMPDAGQKAPYSILCIVVFVVSLVGMVAMFALLGSGEFQLTGINPISFLWMALAGFAVWNCKKKGQRGSGFGIAALVIYVVQFFYVVGAGS